MNPWPQRLQDYLTVRRAMGFTMQRHEKLLTQFTDYLTDQDVATLTIEDALAWATSPRHGDARWWAARLSMIRGFAGYLHAIDPVHQVPPGGLIPAGPRRIAPHLYTDQEIAALLQAAGTLSFRLRAATYQTLIGLLSATGMRVGEAIRLDRADFDADLAAVTVRGSKFGKSRLLPLHPTAVAGLQDYLRLRDRLMPHPATSALLLSTRGCRLRYQRVWEIFHQLVGQAGLTPAPPTKAPRIHDLRHSFAVATLLDCYRNRADVQSMLPRLSTYLGHTDPRDTYWYLSAAPELLALAADRLEPVEKDSR